jgi:hypothetical protein
MSRPHLRRTFRLFLAAAVVLEAVALAATLWRRSADFHERALFHASEASLFLQHAQLWEHAVSLGCTDIPPDGSAPDYARGAQRCRARAAYEAALNHKYLRAAARPWLIVAPDPPAPD